MILRLGIEINQSGGININWGLRGLVLCRGRCVCGQLVAVGWAVTQKEGVGYKYA